MRRAAAPRPSCSTSRQQVTLRAQVHRASLSTVPRRAYGGGPSSSHDNHHHNNHHGAHKQHPALLDEDPEWINDPRDAHYVRSISEEHRKINKDFDAAYRGMSVYIQAEQIAKPGTFDELRQADLVRKAKVDAAKAAAKKEFAEEKAKKDAVPWRKLWNSF